MRFNLLIILFIFIYFFIEQGAMEKIRKNEEIFMNYERKIQEKREKLKSEGEFEFYYINIYYNKVFALQSAC